MKVNWINEKENLKKLIDEKIAYDTIGKKYGVSGNAVKKAAKKIGIELLERRKINPKETFNRKNRHSETKPKNIKDVESYALKNGEQVSIVKYPNSRGKRVLRKCLHCGKIFETLAIRVRSHGEYFCSIECHIAHMKENASSINEKRAKQIIYQKKSRYGLTEEEYKGLFTKQENKCAICGCEFNENNKGFVDHSHTSNKVRGLLCTKCNTLLGMANDNIEVLENAIKYLRNMQ